jgi:competence ComEA-like helix-hairpin-helix protein
MLREWTGAGYTTRDYFNFAQPLVIEAPARLEPAVQPTAVAPKPEPLTPAKPAHKPAFAPAPSAAPAQARSPAKATKAAKPAAGISINHATSEEFASVKGITKSAITAILAGRPYTTIDQLSKVKGVGKKTLAKIRASLVL